MEIPAITRKCTIEDDAGKQCETSNNQLDYIGKLAQSIDKIAQTMESQGAKNKVVGSL